MIYLVQSLQYLEIPAIQGVAFYTIIRRSCYHQQQVVLYNSAFFVPHTPDLFLLSTTYFSFSFRILTSDLNLLSGLGSGNLKKHLNLQEKDSDWQLLSHAQWNSLRQDTHIWPETGVICLPNEMSHHLLQSKLHFLGLLISKCNIHSNIQLFKSNKTKYLREISKKELPQKSLPLLLLLVEDEWTTTVLLIAVVLEIP